MGSNNHIDESICHYSSNEEEVDVDLQQASDDEEEDDEQQSKSNSLGGRWYECVFCKRGFTTAQALGGHMNIHRKDRAKNNHTSSISSSAMRGCYYDHHHKDSYTGPRDYQPILHGGYSPPPPPPPLLLSPSLGGTELGYPVYSPDQYTHNNNYGKSLYPCVGDDWSMKLSLQLGSAAAGMVHDYHMERKGERSRVNKELDLELRLGPDP